MLGSGAGRKMISQHAHNRHPGDAGNKYSKAATGTGGSVPKSLHCTLTTGEVYVCKLDFNKASVKGERVSEWNQWGPQALAS